MRECASDYLGVPHSEKDIVSTLRLHEDFGLYIASLSLEHGKYIEPNRWSEPA